MPLPTSTLPALRRVLGGAGGARRAALSTAPGATLVELRDAVLRPLRAPGAWLEAESRRLNARRGAAPEDNAADAHASSRLLAGTSWALREGEHWLFIGGNGSGKTTLAQSLRGGAHVVGGKILYGEGVSARDIAYVSVKDDHALSGLLRRVQELGGWNRLTNADLVVRDLLLRDRPSSDGPLDPELLRALGVEALLDRHLEQLSTGQLRKLSLARVLQRRPRALVLDEPFDGLDAASRADLAACLGRLSGVCQFVLISHREAEVRLLPFLTHALSIDARGGVAQGPIGDVLGGGQSSVAAPLPLLDHDVVHPSAEACRARVRDLLGAPPPRPPLEQRDPIVEVRSLRVAFAGAPAATISRLDWVVIEGEHWVVEGPNGAGVSRRCGTG